MGNGDEHVYFITLYKLNISGQFTVKKDGNFISFTRVVPESKDTVKKIPINKVEEYIVGNQIEFSPAADKEIFITHLNLNLNLSVYLIRSYKYNIFGTFAVKQHDNFIEFTMVKAEEGNVYPESLKTVQINIDDVVEAIADHYFEFHSNESRHNFILYFNLTEKIDLRLLTLHDIDIFKEIVNEINKANLVKSVIKSFNKKSVPTCIYLYRKATEKDILYDAKTDYITPEISKKLIIIHSLYNKYASINIKVFESKFARSHDTQTCDKYSQLLNSLIVKAEAEAILYDGEWYEPITKKYLGRFQKWKMNGWNHNGVRTGFYIFEQHKIYDVDYNNNDVLKKLQIKEMTDENVRGGKMRSRKARRKRRRTLKKHRKTKSRK